MIEKSWVRVPENLFFQGQLPVMTLIFCINISMFYSVSVHSEVIIGISVSVPSPSYRSST